MKWREGFLFFIFSLEEEKGDEVRRSYVRSIKISPLIGNNATITVYNNNSLNFTEQSFIVMWGLSVVN